MIHDKNPPFPRRYAICISGETAGHINEVDDEFVETDAWKLCDGKKILVDQDIFQTPDMP